MKKLNVAVVFGGVSAEHEVSVITGLQVVEKIDRDKYEPYAIYLSKDGVFKYFKGLKTRKDFTKEGGANVFFGRDANGSFFSENRALIRKTRIDEVYLAFHGGNGESGQLQGFFETLELPYTSPNVEASAITMNKALTKEVLKQSNIPSLDSITVNSAKIKKGELNKIIADVTKNFGLPVIIKPVHLGSSIAINVAKTKVELKKYLLEAAYVDSEIIIEKFLTGFSEYNCAVRFIDGNLEASEVERPISKDEILSFADKYQRGSKKQSGMASLNRELPAKISLEMREKIQETAKKVFDACRCKGMVRIDFMVTKPGKIYVTEVNPIPGSMAYYLWEATGISFTKQITDLLEQAVRDNDLRNSRKLDYETDIVEKFVKS